jgi:CRISPR-associated protein Cas5/CasD subtype I-E
MKYLVLRLSAPLMSFGEGDYWDIRGTDVFPTKSAIVGIISCCLGYDRSDTENIAKLSDSISVSARQDNQFTLLRDYHTIMDTMKANGEPNKNAVQSYRQYLMDAEFTILISSADTSVYTQIKEALLDPVWPIFLGRKSCSPAFPIFWNEEIDADNVEYAFKEIKLVRKKKEAVEFADFFKRKNNEATNKKFPCITDEKITGKKTLTRDNVINSKLRIFSQRETTKFFVEIN